MDVYKVDLFHTTIAKELFLCKRERPDIQPKFPFLFNRVKGPDEDNWKNLLRMIKYLKETQDDEMTFKINNITMTYWYDYAYFVVHVDMKSHTGGINHG